MAISVFLRVDNFIVEATATTVEMLENFGLIVERCSELAERYFQTGGSIVRPDAALELRQIAEQGMQDVSNGIFRLERATSDLSELIFLASALYVGRIVTFNTAKAVRVILSRAIAI